MHFSWPYNMRYIHNILIKDRHLMEEKYSGLICWCVHLTFLGRPRPLLAGAWNTHIKMVTHMPLLFQVSYHLSDNITRSIRAVPVWKTRGEGPRREGFWKCVGRGANTLFKCVCRVVNNKSKCGSRGERWYSHFLNGVYSSNKTRKVSKIT